MMPAIVERQSPRERLVAAMRSGHLDPNKVKLMARLGDADAIALFPECEISKPVTSQAARDPHSDTCLLAARCVADEDMAAWSKAVFLRVMGRFRSYYWRNLFNELYYSLNHVDSVDPLVLKENSFRLRGTLKDYSDNFPKALKMNYLCEAAKHALFLQMPPSVSRFVLKDDMGLLNPVTMPLRNGILAACLIYSACYSSVERKIQIDEMKRYLNLTF